MLKKKNRKKKKKKEKKEKEKKKRNKFRACDLKMLLNSKKLAPELNIDNEQDK